MHQNPNKQLELSKTAVSDAQKIVDSLNADISQKLANLNNAKKLLVDSKVEASKLHSLTEGRKAILESDERALEEAKNLLDADKAKLAEGVATLQNLQIKLDELNDADINLAQAQADHDKAVTELVKAEKALNDAKVPNDKAQKAYQDALKIEKDAKQKLDDAQSALNKIIAHEQAEEAIKNAEAEKAKQQAQIAAQGYYTNNKGQHINAKGQLVNDKNQTLNAIGLVIDTTKDQLTESNGGLAPVDFSRKRVTNSSNTKGELPKTGESNEDNAVWAGLTVLLGMLGMVLGFKRGKHAA